MICSRASGFRVLPQYPDLVGSDEVLLQALGQFL